MSDADPLVGEMDEAKKKKQLDVEVSTPVNNAQTWNQQSCIKYDFFSSP